MVGLRIQQRVQRLFHRRPCHSGQMCLNASLVNLNRRPQAISAIDGSVLFCTVVTRI